MGDAKHELLSNKSIKERIRRFSSILRCTKVGLRYGSCVYFDMGGELMEQFGTKQLPVGVATLELLGYKWTIREDGKDIINSNIITRSRAEGFIHDRFKDLSLYVMNFDKRQNTLTINFEHFVIHVQADTHDPVYRDTDLAMFVQPDGQALSCSVDVGFWTDGSVSRVRAENWENSLRRQMKPATFSKAAPSEGDH
jgi:hypothetical protein